MPRRLGEILLEKNLLSLESLNQALHQHGSNDEMLGATLVKMGFISEEQLLESLSEQLNMPLVELAELAIDPAIVKKVPARLVQHYKIMPVRWEDDVLTVAVSNPHQTWALEDMRLHLGCEVRPVLALRDEISEAIKTYYGIGADTIERILAEKQKQPDAAPQSGGVSLEESAEDIEKRAEDASVIKLVDQILQEAIAQRATDIHVEPFRDELAVRYRVDGILYDTKIPPQMKVLYSAIVSRIKIMARLNIAERRLPQDGRFKIKLGPRELDLRVSILPSVYGEHVVLRLLPTEMLWSLEKLGLLPDDMLALQQILDKPHGIVLVTGPTGSGKTTTLYASLTRLNGRDVKIITVEDPVEYELRGITQIQVAPKIQLTFANSLRSILRHDPDILMIGEIRDLETAEIAIQAALTGHLVFSTLHTNDAASGVTRLMQMGIQPYLIASSMEAIIAQRLVRVICPDCKQKVSHDPGQTAMFRAGMTAQHRGKGCDGCRQTGYRGRTAIYEILSLSEPIRELVLRRASADEIKRKAREEGMRTLFQDGAKKVAEGITTPSEILLCTQPD